MIKVVKVIAIVVCVAYIAAIVGVRLAERWLVYQPGARAVDDPSPALALNQRSVRFVTPDSVNVVPYDRTGRFSSISGKGN